MKKEEFKKLVREQIKLIISEDTPTRQLTPGEKVVINNNEYQGQEAEFVSYSDGGDVKVKVEVSVPFKDIETVIDESKKHGLK